MKTAHTATSPTTTCELISREASKPRSPQGRVGSPQRTQNSGAMRRSFRLSAFVFALFFAFAATSFGQTNYVSWNFNTSITNANYSTNQTNQDAARSTGLTNPTFAGISLSNVSGVTGNTFHRTSGWPTSATIDSTEYIQYSINLAAGQFFPNSALTLNMSAQTSSATAAPTRFQVRYGYGSSPTYADAGTEQTIGTTTTNHSISIPAPSDNVSTLLTIRIHCYNSSTATGNFRLISSSLSGAAPITSATAPTITSFTPTSGAVGDSVTITGTNFASNATVSFNGTSSTSVTFTNNTSLTATVPAGATSGPITVTVGAESGVSSTSFTVVNPSAPAISTNGTFTAFSTTSGNASAAQTLGVTGTNLTASITATAPTGFEVSTDGTSFASNATITQSSGSASATLSVRIASSASVGALSGNLTLASTGATSVSIPLSGNVTGISTDSLATWVGNGNLNNANATVSANAAALNVASATVSRTGLTYNSNANRYSSTGWNATTNFLSITVNAATGYTLDLNGANFTAAMGSSNTGPANYQVFSSADNFAAALGTLASSNSTYPSTTIALSGAGFTGLSSITFRIVGNQTAWNGSATPGTGTGGPNSIIVTGTVNPDSGVTAPVVTPATIGGTVGTALSYSINATNSPTSYGNTTALPAGLSLNATTGLISGTPASAGNTTTTVTATNSGGTGNATLTFVIAPAPGSPFDTWAGGNVTMTPAVLSLYAIGGGSYNGTVAPEAPVLSTTGGNLSLTAIVRTNDPALTVTSESVASLDGIWTSLGNGTVSGNQSGVGPGLQRREFSTPMDGTKKFLRLRAVYAGDN